MSDSKTVTRRQVIAGAAAAASGALLAQVPLVEAQQAPAIPGNPSAAPGAGTTALGARSPFETPARAPTGVQTGSSFSPLQDLTGTITPSDLVFERHHSGVPAIDPSKHRLLVHGLSDRQLVFTLADLERLPSVSRIHFLECSGNGRAAFRDPKPAMTPQEVDGLVSNGEWTGVLLATLLRQAGVRAAARWVIAEGSDSAKLTRSVPLEKAMDDAIVAYAFNGEPLRPSNGYPVRLLLPGFEGNMSVKWLRRLELSDQPLMARDETSRYTDPLADGTARQFSFVMDVKSLITRPSHPQRLQRGWHEVAGIAWTGRGRIARVDISTDGGRRWTQAELQDPVLPKALTRFRLMWNWDGRETTILSRATDETGAVQPTREAFVAARGAGTDYHFSWIRSWRVAADGRVSFHS